MTTYLVWIMFDASHWTMHVTTMSGLSDCLEAARVVLGHHGLLRPVHLGAYCVVT